VSAVRPDRFFPVFKTFDFYFFLLLFRARSSIDTKNTNSRANRVRVSCTHANRSQKNNNVSSFLLVRHVDTGQLGTVRGDGVLGGGREKGEKTYDLKFSPLVYENPSAHQYTDLPIH
jgi:hypothetical protein